MFTGLIQQVGVVESARGTAGGRLLTVSLEPMWEGVHVGESVAVAGVCLTVTALGARRLSFDVSPETLERSTLGKAAPGRKVNLERALRPTDRLGGHFVSGHVDCVGQCTKVVRQGDFARMSFQLLPGSSRYVAQKGSVAVDGVSLTVASVSGDSFGVAIIPATLGATTLSDLRPSDKVNIETDILARYVERLLSAGPGRGARDMEEAADRGGETTRDDALQALLREKGFGA